MKTLLGLLFALQAIGQSVLPPVQPTPLEVSRMTNVSNGQVIDNRSSFIGQNNYWGFCGSGTGVWSVDLQYSDQSSSGPWITPGGSASISNYSASCVGSFLGFHNWFRFRVVGSAVVRYSAVKDFWLPVEGGQVSISIPVVPYVVNAATSPQLIPLADTGQGQNVVVQCFSGPLTVDFHVTGKYVACQYANDGQGDITVVWYDNTVGSIMVSAAGPGPLGPAGLGAAPYVTNALTSPQTITQGTHGQGFNPAVFCFSGPLVNFHITGTQYPCTVSMQSGGNGDVTVSWPGSAVGSIMVQTSGTPQPYVQTSTTSPMVITQATHNRGFNASTHCWSGAIVSGITTGAEVLCATARASNGDVTVTWSGNSVLSVSIQ